MTDTLPARTDAATDAAVERLLTTQMPQRPQVAPVISLEIDGRTLTGRQGQTLLEVCRDNGIEVPTLCYEPKLPGFGACRMCVVEVEGGGGLPSVRFSVEALLRMDPSPELVVFDTVLEVARGEFDVRDGEGGDAGPGPS